MSCSQREVCQRDVKSVGRMMESGREIPMDENILALEGQRRGKNLITKDEGLRRFHRVRTTRKFNLILAEDTRGKEVNGLFLTWFQSTTVSSCSKKDPVKL